MTKLTGPEIATQVRLGNIIIDPYEPGRLGPNSYDVTLGPHLATYRAYGAHADQAGALILDSREELTESHLDRCIIPLKGKVLYPGILYLGHTNEVAGVPADSTAGYVPMLDGKSGVGRLGITIHVTAGFGDDGFVGNWTLEITVVHPVRVYAGQVIGQLSFEPVHGTRAPYTGNYQGQLGPVPSRLWRSFSAPT